MKIIDPAHTLDGSGPTVEVLPIAGPTAPPRPRWWRHPWRAWRVRKLPDAIQPRFRLRVLDTAGQVVLDVDDYGLYLMLLYGGMEDHLC